MKKVLIIGGVLLLLIVLVAAMAGDENGDTTSTNGNGNGTEEVAEEEEGNSRNSPIPIGELSSIDGWDIKVTGTTPNGTDAVLAENQFNDPPAEGRQFFIAAIEATFTGEGTDEESSQFWIDVRTNVVDNNNVTYSSMEDYCGVIPNPLEDTNEVFVGGTVTGNLCWPVASDQVDSLVMFAEPMFSFSSDRTWFALN